MDIVTATKKVLEADMGMMRMNGKYALFQKDRDEPFTKVLAEQHDKAFIDNWTPTVSDIIADDWVVFFMD